MQSLPAAAHGPSLRLFQTHGSLAGWNKRTYCFRETETGRPETGALILALLTGHSVTWPSDPFSESPSPHRLQAENSPASPIVKQMKWDDYESCQVGFPHTALPPHLFCVPNSALGIGHGAVKRQMWPCPHRVYSLVNNCVTLEKLLIDPT